jgi:hypothetical protein
MGKWEYIAVELRQYKGQVLVAGPAPWTNKELGELGDQGWEAVSSLRVEGQELLLLKRPIT